MGSKTYSPTARTETQRLRRQLDALVLRCEGVPEGEEIRADLYRYAYIQLAGFLEQSLLLAGRSLVHQRAVAEAREYALTQLERFRRNPTEGTILAFVQSFSDQWAEELGIWFSVDSRGDQINALVGIRNGIAHGTSFGGGARSFDGYYVVVTDLADWLVDRFETSLP